MVPLICGGGRKDRSRRRAANTSDGFAAHRRCSGRGPGASSAQIGLYMAWIFDGRYRAPRWLRRFEELLDTGAQNWKQYALAFMLFNLGTFVVGFTVLSLQPYLPLNPDGKGMLAPTTIFHTVIS